MTDFRSPGRTPLCSSCGSASLTPPTGFSARGGEPYLYFREVGEKATLLGGQPSHPFKVDQARVCLECGHVMLGLSGERLAELRRRIASFEPFLT